MEDRMTARSEPQNYMVDQGDGILPPRRRVETRARTADLRSVRTHTTAWQICISGNRARPRRQRADTIMITKISQLMAASVF